MEKSKKACFTMVMGLPRSGKSTWVRKNAKDALIVCPDEIRMEIFGHEFFKPAEEFVWAAAKMVVRLALMQKMSVFLDATNVNYATRYPWLKMAKELGASTRVVHIATPLKECLKRNDDCTRMGARSVPQGVIEGMAAMTGVVGADEADKVMTVRFSRTKVKRTRRDK